MIIIQMHFHLSYINTSRWLKHINELILILKNREIMQNIIQMEYFTRGKIILQ